MAQANADMQITFAATGQDQVSGALNGINNQFHRTEKVVNSTTKTMDRQFRLIRGGLGQVGHQVQDIAVQLQAGQNALLVFGQQGSQIASLMGPNGAIIGAFLAVGAALGTAFMPALFESGKAAEDLQKRIEDAAKETENLTEAQLAFLAVRYADQLEEQRQKLEEIADSTESFTKQLNIAANEQKYVDETSASYQVAGERIEEMQGKIIKSAAETEELNNQMAETEKNLAIIKAGGNPFYDMENGAKKARDELDSLFDRLYSIQQASMAPTSQFDKLRDAYINDANFLDDILNRKRISEEQYNQTAIGRAEQYERDVLELSNKRLTKAQDSLSKNFAELDQMQKEADSDKLAQMMAQFELEQVYINDNLAKSKEAAKALTEDYKAQVKAREDLATAEQNVRADTLSALQSTVGMAASLFKEGTSAQKAAFLAQQALAIATTLINTETAATAALAPPPIGLGPVAGLPYSATIRAAGYTSAALIAGQTLASFEGGGFTGFGARAGGLDGKGGRLAMLHPNETVLDHTKGQGQGITIVNNVDATGGGADVDQRIRVAMEVTSQQTVMQVQDLLRRQRLV